MAMPGYGFDPNLPPEIDAENQRIAKQQAIAEAMLQRSMTPLPTNQGPLHWTQALAQIVNARQGRVDVDAAAKARAGLGEKYQQGLAEEVKRIAAMRQGTPGTVQDTSAEGTGSFDMSGSAGPANAPGVQPNARGAVEAAMLSQYAPVRAMGTAEYTHLKKSDEPYTLKPGEGRYGPDGKLLNYELPKEPIEKAFKAGDIRKFLDGGSEVTQEFQANGTWKEISRGSRREGGVTVQAPVTPVTIKDPANPNNTIIVDGRTGKKIGDGPKLTETGKAEFKRQFNMQGIGATIQQAEDLLGGVVRRDDGSVDPMKKGATPTGSGVGNVVDKALGLVGKSTQSGDLAAQMRALGGALVSKMPRMEGPQSDKDVALYKEMAGQIGDANVPLSQRKVALDEVKRLWAKYERLNPEAFSGQPAAGAGDWSVVR